MEAGKFSLIKKFIYFKKLNAFIYLLLLSFLPIHAQIGGVSASKLATINTETVSVNKIEFEPAFSSFFYRKAWDEGGNMHLVSKNGDSLFVESAFSFRFTYGIASNLEIGLTVPSDVSSLSFGAKYRFITDLPFSYGLLFGVNTPLGNGAYFVNRKAAGLLQYHSTLVGGMVATYDLSDDLSVDLDVQYQRHIEKSAENDFHNHDLFIDIDAGYYFTSGLQAILGINYFSTHHDGGSGNISKLTLNPGMTIEKAKNFIIVLNLPYDVYGENTANTVGVSFALTILME